MIDIGEHEKSRIDIGEHDWRRINTQNNRCELSEYEPNNIGKISAEAANIS